MKNLKISAKLIVSFLIIAALAAAVGITGIIGMVKMDAAASDMYINQTEPLQHVSNLTTLLQRMRVNMREYAIGAAVKDADQIENAHATIADINKLMTENFDDYSATITNAEARALFDEARKAFEGGYQDHLLECYERAKAGDLAGCIETLRSAKADTDLVESNIDRCMQIKIDAAGVTNESTGELSRLLLFVIIGVLAFAMTVAIVLALYISGLISKPVGFMKDVLFKMGKEGVVNFSDEEYRQAEAFAYKDEVGESIKMLIETGRRLETVGHALETVAGGDLTAELNLLSNNDTMGLALQKMVENLNNMFGEINSASNQVSTGSVQIADGAQLLAQGATEQSATVEELSASVAEIASQTKANAGIANETSDLAENIKVSAEQGSRQMEQMMQAVAEINESSKSIGKVIKIIDDIAFQTNILALNAAVEAARAGQHGKGFAVVADEVRSLAAKSAEAAKNTNELIESSIQKAEQGASISAETSESLQQIVEGILKTSELVSDIAKSSNEQSIAISQIGEAIDQVSQVVQQNSATAEESAAASEEMSGQATLLQQLISQFKLKTGMSGGVYSSSTASHAAPISSSIKSGTGFAIDSGSKY